MAVRLSIGAGRGQLIRQLLGESCLLALFGGIGGLVVAQWTLNLMAALLPPKRRNTIDFSIDRRMSCCSPRRSRSAPGCSSGCSRRCTARGRI